MKRRLPWPVVPPPFPAPFVQRLHALLGQPVSFAGAPDHLQRARRAVLSQSGTFVGHRPYVRGDDLRRIDWAAYARTGALYCKQLEPELAGIDNVTVYTFLVPFQGEARPVAIWCAADRERAWRYWMLQADASMLQSAANCEHPIARNLELARRLGVQGTPTLIWADGARTNGYVGRQVLEARLAEAAKVASQSAASGKRP